MEPPPHTTTVEDPQSTSIEEYTPQPGLARPQMFRFLSSIFENVVPRDHTGSGFDEWPSMFERADDGLETSKALRAVGRILRYLREKSPATVVPATKALADGSRYGKVAMADLDVVQERKGTSD